MDAQETYRFRWSNYDLDRYVQACEAKARKLRNDAVILIARAEQIEEQAADLSNSLERVEDKELAPCKS